jgi:hypothetical protein
MMMAEAGVFLGPVMWAQANWVFYKINGRRRLVYGRWQSSGESLRL